MLLKIASMLFMEIKTPVLIDADKLKVYEWFYSQLESLIKSTNIALNSKEEDILHLGNFKIDSLTDTNN